MKTVSLLNMPGASGEEPALLASPVRIRTVRVVARASQPRAAGAPASGGPGRAVPNMTAAYSRWEAVLSSCCAACACLSPAFRLPGARP